MPSKTTNIDFLSDQIYRDTNTYRLEEVLGNLAKQLNTPNEDIENINNFLGQVKKYIAASRHYVSKILIDKPYGGFNPTTYDTAGLEDLMVAINTVSSRLDGSVDGLSDSDEVQHFIDSAVNFYLNFHPTGSPPQPYLAALAGNNIVSMHGRIQGKQVASFLAAEAQLKIFGEQQRELSSKVEPAVIHEIRPGAANEPKIRTQVTLSPDKNLSMNLRMDYIFQRRKF